MTHRTLVLTRANFLRLLLLTCFLVVITTAGSCSKETLFQSNFDSTDFNQPPSPTQGVGTATISGGPSSVLVAAAPPDASPPAKWLKLVRPNADSDFPNFVGKFVRVPGDGTYTFSSALVIPEGNGGPVTVQFENTAGQGFFHLDFMPDGKVRIDDDAGTIFGSVHLKQVLIVQVTLTVTSGAPSTAKIVLSGAGASGQADRTIRADLQPLSHQFGAVRLFIGFPNVGTFHATTIAVTRAT